MKVELLMIKMPNFIRYKLNAGETSKLPEPCVPVESLTEEDAHEYAERMKQAFMQHWHSKQVTIKKQYK